MLPLLKPGGEKGLPLVNDVIRQEAVKNRRESISTPFSGTQNSNSTTPSGTSSTTTTPSSVHPSREKPRDPEEVSVAKENTKPNFNSIPIHHKYEKAKLAAHKERHKNEDRKRREAEKPRKDPQKPEKSKKHPKTSQVSFEFRT